MLAVAVRRPLALHPPPSQSAARSACGTDVRSAWDSVKALPSSALGPASGLARFLRDPHDVHHRDGCPDTRWLEFVW